MERDLPALGFGDEQVRQAIAIDIGPEQAAAGLVGFVERQNLKLSLLKSAGEQLGGLARELRNLRPAGILGDGNHVDLAVLLEIVSQIRAGRRESKINLPAQLAP